MSIENLSDLDLQNPIHFIGIGGSGMSGLALVLRTLGYPVSGSDMADGPALDNLRKAGVAVSIDHNGGNVPQNAQLVVASAAIKETNPEYEAATFRNIPIVKYARMLGLVMRGKTGVCIAGTHGKTTTTGMVAFALRELGADPSFVIGGLVPQLGGGSGAGRSEYLVAEACEYDRSFLNLFPKYAVINNIEEDHLDYYKDLDEIVGAFRDFALRLPPDGLLVYSANSTNTARFLADVPCRAIACALEQPADYWADEIRFENGKSHYRLRRANAPAGAPAECEVALDTFGRHNVINSLVAIALLCELGFPMRQAAEGVGKFRGVNRRFDIIHDKDITIVDDYAHHPTEVRTVLKSSKTYFDGRRVVAVFQPHQHSRTRFLMRDFASSFQFADLVIVPDIYFVRDSEQERALVHAKDLVRAIIKNGGNAVYIPSFTEIEQFLSNNLGSGDVLITMGAGNVWKIGQSIAGRMPA